MRAWLPGCSDRQLVPADDPAKIRKNAIVAGCWSYCRADLVEERGWVEGSKSKTGDAIIRQDAALCLAHLGEMTICEDE